MSNEIKEFHLDIANTTDLGLRAVKGKGSLLEKLRRGWPHQKIPNDFVDRMEEDVEKRREQMLGQND